jgi:signal transduction histidine kinase
MIELGGRIEAHSDGPGHGARFVLDLPLQAAGVTP